MHLRTILIVALAQAVTVTVTAQSSSLLWHQSESVATFTTAGVSAQRSASPPGPTFSFATWLNQPVFVEVASALTPSGSSLWSFNGDSSSDNFGVTMARHGNATSNSVDTFGVETSSFGSLGSCTVYGWRSLGGSATAVWNHSYDYCTSNLFTGGSYISLEASDAGNIMAALLDIADKNGTANVTAHVYVFNGQTGDLHFVRDLSVPASQGQIQVTPNGAWVMLLEEDNGNGGKIYVMDAVTGAVRGGQPVISPFFIAAAISDDGQWLAIGDDGSVLIYQWGGTAYTQTRSVSPPDGSWIAWDIQTASGVTAPAAVVGWISGDVLGLRLTAHDVATGALLTDWSAPRNAKLQNSPNLKTHGRYIAMSMWGDAGGDAPTAVLLRLGSNALLHNSTSPGSMFAVDVLVDPVSSNSTTDIVYLVVAGKATPANVAGNGGDAYAYMVTVPL